KPAFVKNRDAAAAMSARGTLGCSMGDEQTHRRFEPRVIAQLLDVKKQPGIIERNRCRTVKKLRVHSLFTRPTPQLYGREVPLIHHPFVLFLIAPLRKFIPQV